jgi:hypothetical protein
MAIILLLLGVIAVIIVVSLFLRLRGGSSGAGHGSGVHFDKNNFDPGRAADKGYRAWDTIAGFPHGIQMVSAAICALTLIALWKSVGGKGRMIIGIVGAASFAWALQK